jgi:uncharacterized protein YkuJ
LYISRKKELRKKVEEEKKKKERQKSKGPFICQVPYKKTLPGLALKSKKNESKYSFLFVPILSIFERAFNPLH